MFLHSLCFSYCFQGFSPVWVPALVSQNDRLWSGCRLNKSFFLKRLLVSHDAFIKAIASKLEHQQTLRKVSSTEKVVSKFSHHLEELSHIITFYTWIIITNSTKVLRTCLDRKLQRSILMLWGFFSETRKPEGEQWEDCTMGQNLNVELQLPFEEHSMPGPS